MNHCIFLSITGMVKKLW